MRNRIATTVLAGIAYLVSPQSAKAQETYVCDNQQHALLVSVPSSLDTLSNALSSSCLVTSMDPSRCGGPIPSTAIKSGMMKTVNMVESVEYDLHGGSVKINLNNGTKKGFHQYPHVADTNVLETLVKTYCTATN